MVLVQTWVIFQLFFLGNIGHVNILYDNLARKYAFLGYKSKKFKKPKKTTFFQNGLTHTFGPKMVNFLTFFFWQYRPG